MSKRQLRYFLFAAMAAMLVPRAVLGVAFPGPDSFGYLGQTIPFNLRDVSATGTDIGLNSDDATTLVPIGFNFPFYGVSYSNVEVSTNGFISFTPTGTHGCCSGVAIPSPGGIDNLIAGYWEDLDPGRGGTIRTQTLGIPGSREFVVGYYQIPDFDDSTNSVNTFEVILHEGTGNIELQLAQIQYDSVDSKVIGIENINGTDGIQVAFFAAGDPNYDNGDFLFDDQAFLFTRVPEPGALSLLGTLCPLTLLRRPRRLGVGALGQVR